jgi:putative chitinase
VAFALVDLFFRKGAPIVFKFDDQKLLSAYVAAFPGPTPRADQVAGAGKLMGFISADPAISDIRWAAYMLATVKHECADTWVPINERGSSDYFHKYEADTPLGHRLGNTQDGDGFRFRGRGYVQITGRANYDNLGRQIGLNDGLLKNPDQALDPQIAYKIMSLGMRKGCFTGKKLSDYINQNTSDYVNARRIINGTDQAERIAGYAAKLQQVLTAALMK